MLVKAVNNLIVTVNVGLKIIQRSSSILAQPSTFGKNHKEIAEMSHKTKSLKRRLGISLQK